MTCSRHKARENLHARATIGFTSDWLKTDHKPLETILKKPIHQAPLRLQKMILRTKPYALNVRYIPGTHLVLAYALSRAFLPILRLQINLMSSKSIF